MKSDITHVVPDLRPDATPDTLVACGRPIHALAPVEIRTTAVLSCRVCAYVMAEQNRALPIERELAEPVDALVWAWLDSAEE